MNDKWTYLIVHLIEAGYEPVDVAQELASKYRTDAEYAHSSEYAKCLNLSEKFQAVADHLSQG